LRLAFVEPGEEHKRAELVWQLRRHNKGLKGRICNQESIEGTLLDEKSLKADQCWEVEFGTCKP
jgi:hypothetical protein